MRPLILLAALALALAAWVAAADAQTTEDLRGFDLIDQQGKGFVTLLEYMTIMEGQPNAQADFQAMDANGDLIVTKEEFLAAKPVYKK